MAPFQSRAPRVRHQTQPDTVRQLENSTLGGRRPTTLATSASMRLRSTFSPPRMYRSPIPPRRKAARCPLATSSTWTRLRPVFTTPGIRPQAHSTMMRPVGVGFTSRGPIGAEGLTMTAGSRCCFTISSTSRSARTLLFLYEPMASPCVYRKPRLGRNGDGVRQGRGAT
jgi:hypothetical protein